MVERRGRLSLLAALAAVAAMTMAGCADADKEPKTIPSASDSASGGVSYVGKVEGTAANIGLVTTDDQLAGFVCEDENSSLRLDPVLLGNGSAELLHDGKAVGSVTISDDGAAGQVEFGGEQRTFAAEVATGKAGVYRLAPENPDAWDGWVVLNDGTYTGTSKNKPSAAMPWVNPDIDP